MENMRSSRTRGVRHNHLTHNTLIEERSPASAKALCLCGHILNPLTQMLQRIKPKSMTRFYNLIAGRDWHKSWTWGITFILLVTAITNSYTQCDQLDMACNDFVQVSLDNDCQVVIRPDMVLEGGIAHDSFYRVTVWDGSVPIGDTITDFYVNRRLEVSIRCKATGVSCWGYIGIEDKLSPVVEIFPPMVMVDCNEADGLLEVTDSTGNPFAFIDSFFVDNGGCEKIDTLILMEEVEQNNGDCGRDGVIKTLTRTFIVTDNAGNVGSAQQVIVVKKGELSDVSYPRDTVISCIDLPANGFDPDIFGSPSAPGCDIFKSFYTDTRFPLCGGSFKILRTWIVVDWCEGKDTSVTQILESLDTLPPVWNMNFEISPGSTYAGSQACIGSITVPLEEYAAATDLCYALKIDDYKVRYRKGDLNAPDGFEAQIRTDVTIWPNGDALISDLPLGVHQIIITATDACGNSDSAVRQFSIEDNTPPNAVCESITTAVVDFNGISELMAFTLDDHSFDNCGIDRFKVKRLDTFCAGFEDDLIFGPSVHFCCDDIPDTISVVLRVYDQNDRYSECIVDVMVQDKRPVNLICGPDVEVNCDFNFNNLAARLGTPSVQADVCTLDEPQLHMPEIVMDDCGNGMFFAKWTISDFSSIRDSCFQKITIRNFSNPTITIPGSINREGCDATQAHPKFINSEPTFVGVDCEMMASSWIDDVDEDPNSGCIKISRKWTVIDWCTFDATNVNTILSQGTQIVTLTDNEDPVVLDCPASVEVVDSDDNCFHFVDLLLRASDNCTLSEELSYAYAIDLFKDGTIDTLGNTADASEIYPVGTHHISWTVTDRCGNINSTCEYDFSVLNAFGSGFSGTESISLNIQNNMMISLSIQTLMANVDINCLDGLSLSFSDTEDQQEIVYDCDDLDDGVSDTVQQILYVSDGQGNARGEVTIEVLLTDNTNVCPDLNGVAALIRGVLADENNVVVPNVSVTLRDRLTGAISDVTTNNQGEYLFDGLTEGRSYDVLPKLEGNDVLGISTIDMLQIQRHILGLASFTSPYKILAADINNSKGISASDLVLIQKLILGFDNVMTNNDPWKFVPGEFIFDSNSPFDYPEEFNTGAISSGFNTVNFVGVKVGDVNGNAFPALLNLGTDPRSKVNVKYSIGQVSDNLYKVDFKLANDMNITGLQMSIKSNGIELVERDNGTVDLRNANIAVKDDQIKISWISPYGTDMAEDEIMFTFLISGRHIDKLWLDNRFSAELYDGDLESHKISLEKDGIERIERGLEVFQNQPNPFSESTSISFMLPEKDYISLKVYDINGRILLETDGTYDRGINHIDIKKEDINGTGVLYYTIETSSEIKGQRMILLH